MIYALVHECWLESLFQISADWFFWSTCCNNMNGRHWAYIFNLLLDIQHLLCDMKNPPFNKILIIVWILWFTTAFYNKRTVFGFLWQCRLRNLYLYKYTCLQRTWYSKIRNSMLLAIGVMPFTPMHTNERILLWLYIDMELHCML